MVASGRAVDVDCVGQAGVEGVEELLLLRQEVVTPPHLAATPLVLDKQLIRCSFRSRLFACTGYLSTVKDIKSGSDLLE